MSNLEVIYLYNSLLVHLYPRFSDASPTNAKCSHFKYLYKFHCELTCFAPRLGELRKEKENKQ